MFGMTSSLELTVQQPFLRTRVGVSKHILSNIDGARLKNRNVSTIKRINKVNNEILR